MTLFPTVFLISRLWGFCLFSVHAGGCDCTFEAGNVVTRTPREGHHEEAGTMGVQVLDGLSVVLGFSL